MSAKANLPAGVELVHGDSANPEAFPKALAGTTAVFVNAAAAGGSAAELMAAAMAAGTSHVVMLSSFAVRDDGPQDYSIGAYQSPSSASPSPSATAPTRPRSPP